MSRLLTIRKVINPSCYSEEIRKHPCHTNSIFGYLRVMVYQDVHAALKPKPTQCRMEKKNTKISVIGLLFLLYLIIMVTNC